MFALHTKHTTQKHFAIDEKIQILGCLQEVGLNSDTRPLLFTKEHKPNLAKFEKATPLLKGYKMKQLYDERLSTKYYKGDASDKTAQQRLQEFALWLFAQRKYLHVVAVGHSHWFQSFFKAYLRTYIAEDALPANVRTRKIRNCGVVAFRIKKRYVPSKSKRHGRHITFEIAPNSITTLQFNLYNAPSTNHDIMAEKAKNAELEDQVDDAILVNEEEEGVVEVNDPSLAQSVSESVSTKSSPGILAYINGDGVRCDDDDDMLDGVGDDNNNVISVYNIEQRPKIPKKSPPPVPSTNKQDEVVGDVVKETKEKKPSFKSVSAGFVKSKHLFARAINRLNGGNSSQNEDDDDKEKDNDDGVVEVVNIDHELKLLGSEVQNGGNEMNATNEEEYVK